MSNPLKPLDDIYKAHQAIAVMPTSGSRITLLMRRFFNTLLEHAQKVGEAETYRAQLDLILDGAEFNSLNYEVAKNALRGMTKTTVEWSVVRDEGSEDGVERRWGVSALLADAEFIHINRRIYLEWSYSPKIRRHLLDPSRYVQLSPHVYSKLSSSTSAALYEVCMRYLTNVGGLTNKAEWEWWRPRLTGVPDGDEAPVRQYKYFKRDTLVPAIIEINSLPESDIQVDFREFKTGNKVTHIQFSARRRVQTLLDIVDTHPIADSSLLKRIEDFGIKASLAAKLYATRDDDTVKATIEYVESRLAKGGVTSPAALFRDALSKGYGKVEAERTKTSSRPKAPAKPKLEKEDPAVALQRKSAQDFLDGLPASQKESLERDLASTLKGIVLADYKKHGLKSKIVQAELLSYVHKKGFP